MSFQDHGHVRGSVGGADEQGRNVLAAVQILQHDLSARKAAAPDRDGGTPPVPFGCDVDAQRDQGLPEGTDGTFAKAAVPCQREGPVPEGDHGGQEPHGRSVVSQEKGTPGGSNRPSRAGDDQILPFPPDPGPEGAKGLHEAHGVLRVQGVPENGPSSRQGGHDQGSLGVALRSRHNDGCLETTAGSIRFIVSEFLLPIRRIVSRGASSPVQRRSAPLPGFTNMPTPTGRSIPRPPPPGAAGSEGPVDQVHHGGIRASRTASTAYSSRPAPSRPGWR